MKASMHVAAAFCGCILGFAPVGGAFAAPKVPDGAREREAISRAVDAEAADAIALLQKIVDLNSGSLNRAGVDRVGDVMEQELRALGFETRRISMERLGRGAHVWARRQGRGAAAKQGRRLLLIGHMDTVFEPFSPFQKFVRDGDRAVGPGVNDMKGGLVVMLSALKALQQAKLLDGATITVFLTADEEATGHPLEAARADMIAAAKEADAALCFESGIRRDGKDYVSTARRGYTGWKLVSTGTPAHSSSIFSERVGDGAIYEIARVLDRFNRELREPNLTYNAGLLAAAQAVELRPDGAGSLQGKPNIVPAEARAIGEFRALTLDQVERVQQKMRAIVADSRPGTKTELTFETGFPPMAPSPGNSALFAEYAAASLAMGLPEVHDLDPMLRGAGDSAFVSPYVPTITGLGAVGEGSHTPQESVDLSLLPMATKRAALTIYRLSRTKPPR